MICDQHVTRMSMKRIERRKELNVPAWGGFERSPAIGEIRSRAERLQGLYWNGTCIVCVCIYIWAGVYIVRNIREAVGEEERERIVRK